MYPERQKTGRLEWPARAWLGLGLLTALLAACGGASPTAPLRPPELLDFILVPRPPPVVPVEIQPPQPAKGAVWVDGQWQWAGDRWRWKHGGWVKPPEGARLSPWTYCYQEDGQVRFWPAVWVDAEGDPIEEPSKLMTTRRRQFDPNR